MTRIIESLAEISSGYDTLFCDLWGCLHNGITPFPEAVAAVRSFREAGGRVVLMTNAPRPDWAVAKMLAKMDMPEDVQDVIVSSGDAAQAAMLRGAVGRAVYHIGPSKDAGFFERIPEEFADAPPIERVPFARAEGIVCTGPFDEDRETPEDYRPTFLAAKARGLKLLCANPDIIVDFGDRRIYCAGALAALYDEMGGESLYFGKPHPPIYDLARNRLAAMGHTPERVLAIGDGLQTDIRGALLEDIDSVFVTGGLAAQETGTERQPDPQKLRQYLTQQQSDPTFSIGYLR